MKHISTSINESLQSANKAHIVNESVSDAVKVTKGSNAMRSIARKTSKLHADVSLELLHAKENINVQAVDQAVNASTVVFGRDVANAMILAQLRTSYKLQDNDRNADKWVFIDESLFDTVIDIDSYCKKMSIQIFIHVNEHSGVRIFSKTALSADAAEKLAKIVSGSPKNPKVHFAFDDHSDAKMPNWSIFVANF